MDENNEQGKRRGLLKGTQLKRSNAYPSITIMQSLSIVEVVYKNAGNSYLTGEQIAKLLNKNFNSITQKLGSCVQYGLLEVKAKIGYKPSSICKQIFKPYSQEEKRNALIECFKKPKLYGEILAKYEDSHLPSPQILPNILDRDHSVYDDAAVKASSVFFDNLKDLELINSNNEISFSTGSSIGIDDDELDNDSAAKQGNEVETHEYDSNSVRNTPKKEAPSVDSDPELSRLYKTDIPLTEGKKAVLFYPSVLNQSDLKLLKGQIDLIGLYVELNLDKNE